MNVLVTYSPDHATRVSPTEVTVPLSKSISNRLSIINALAGNRVLPQRLLAVCDDTEVMRRALMSGNSGRIDVGAAGTAMRFLTAYYAATPGCDITLDGSERMRRRPISILVDALRLIGAHIDYLREPGYPPLHIRGRRLEGGSIELDAGVSSQYTSALLMIAPATTLGIELTLKGRPVSVPYIMMTLAMMEAYGIGHLDTRPDNLDWAIKAGPGMYRTPSAPYKVEGDWSAASYWYETAALTGRSFVIDNLSDISLQGDSRLTDIFGRLGVRTAFEGNRVVITPDQADVADTGEFKLNMVDTPDLAQTVIATCCGLGRPFTIDGLSTLRIKETDRIDALRRELGRLGYPVEIIGDDTMHWDGRHTGPDTDTPAIKTYNDHRMAMSLAPLAARHGRLLIQDADVVSKSYPDYWQQLSRANFTITGRP
ncbi:MAG: 3-phosphoshikimate 1-carboxyvinyltransferase [Muribaculaceae bacterium]|nr:3-phosphoshikimate 1-carboxyvinyltransferase [Muribaculaceae bacterium]